MERCPMRILVFGPYLNPPHYGGGEKYLFDVADYLSREHQVEVGVSSAEPLSSDRIVKLKVSYEEFLGKDLGAVKFVSVPLRTKEFVLKKLFWTKQYDCIFYLTDGSFFFSLANKNIAHIQFPLKLDKSKFWQRKKLDNWDVKVTNSEFTKSIVEPSWPVKVDMVHQPMVNVEQIQEGLDLTNKENIILNVGRFFSHLHAKRQDILVEIFRRLSQKYGKLVQDWKLVLIGSVEEEDYAQKVAKQAEGLNVEIYHQVSRKDLIDWFRRSSIYWHATGYRVNPHKEPEKVEHFGITTVEAMAAGNVPIVIGKGGQLEVVGEDLEEWTWLTQRDCLKKTAQIIRNIQLRQKLQAQAQDRAHCFGPDVFYQKLEEMINA